MNNKIKEKKMEVPRGLLSEIAIRANTSSQSVGATLGIYTDTTIGVSEEKKALIKEIAKEVAMEKVIEYDDFIKALKLP